MSGQTGISGELIYEYTPMITQVVEYGASADVLSGQRSCRSVYVVPWGIEYTRRGGQAKPCCSCPCA